MLQVIPGLPDHVVAFDAIGELTADDYEKVLQPALEAARARHDKVSILYVMGKEFGGFTSGALWDDTKFGVTHATGWGRIALVTDVEWMQHLVKVFGWMTPGDLKLFSTSELDDAKTWVVGS